MSHQKTKKMKGPKFLKYINPVLNQLQLNGGAGNASDIIEKVASFKRGRNYWTKNIDKGKKKVLLSYKESFT